MSNYAHCVITGNLTRDPEEKKVNKDNKVCKFSVAVNHPKRKGADDGETSFFDVEAWNGLADVCSEYLKKGSKVLIAGSLKMQSWTTDSGDRRSKLVITADNVSFLNGNKGK